MIKPELCTYCFYCLHLGDDFFCSQLYSQGDRINLTGLITAPCALDQFLIVPDLEW